MSTMSPGPEAESPISLPVSVARLPAKGMQVTIEADADQRAALAAIHGLIRVDRLSAELDITGWRKDGMRVEGRLSAGVVQRCVVTLEPVEETVEEEISGLFLPEGSRLAVPKGSEEGEIILDAEGEDSPETFTGDAVDVGQLVEEFFALGLNPYPRRPGAELPSAAEGEAKAKGPLSEQLEALKKKL